MGFQEYLLQNNIYDFSVHPTTNDQYCAISNITNAATSDPYAVIGRFEAIDFGTAHLTGQLPTFTPSNLIQRTNI